MQYKKKLRKVMELNQKILLQVLDIFVVINSSIFIAKFFMMNQITLFSSFEIG